MKWFNWVIYGKSGKGEVRSSHRLCYEIYEYKTRPVMVRRYEVKVTFISGDTVTGIKEIFPPYTGRWVYTKMEQMVSLALSSNIPLVLKSLDNPKESVAFVNNHEEPIQTISFKEIAHKTVLSKNTYTTKVYQDGREVKKIKQELEEI